MTEVRVGLADADTTRALRLRVLRGGATDGPDFGDGPLAVHLAATTDDGQVIGSAVVFPQACPARPDVAASWQLRGMAVDQSVQGSGVGSAVLRAALDAVTARGGALLWCNARDTAIAFYERHGFAVDGPGFPGTFQSIPHHAMWVELPREPSSS